MSPKSRSVRLDHLRHLAHLRPLDAGHRIEVHPQLVGMVQIVGADRMRMQLEAGEVGEPGQCRRVARHDFSALLPEGKRSDTTSIHGGREVGARFW